MGRALVEADSRAHSKIEADTLNLWCIEAREYAFALVEEEYPLVMANQAGTAMERVKEKYPQIDDANLATLYNQGMYYAWHV